jgi:hypothetical protein
MSAWKAMRVLLLLGVLLAVALTALLDRVATQSWHEPLWVGIFPLNGDGTPRSQHYLADLSAEDFTDIGTFFVREAHRYGITLEEPVHIELYPQATQPPPELPRDAGPLATAWWSLKLRWYAARAGSVPGRAPPRIRLFVLYHDPATLPTVPDSHGLQKGLVGVVHVFAQRDMNGMNDIIIAHELLHTVGATDKYAPESGAPLFPSGYAAPEQVPLYPQEDAEIMAGRRALSQTRFEMPRSLAHVVVGPATALEIHWKRP